MKNMRPCLCNKCEINKRKHCSFILLAKHINHLSPVKQFRAYDKKQFGRRDLDSKKRMCIVQVNIKFKFFHFLALIRGQSYKTFYTKSITYADNTSTGVSGRILKKVIEQMEEDARRVLTFMASNGLVASPNKTTLLFLYSHYQSCKSFL